ncbi:MAG: hypothetical protein WC831_06125 [Parcubacteria group bacterium]|jgi:hypothetical protein
MEYDWMPYLFLANAILGLIALAIKSKVILDYWPRKDEFGLQYENEIIRKEKKKKVVFNLIFGLFVFFGALFLLAVYRLHPSSSGK